MTLFVFYNFIEKKKWTYEKIPGWNWIGSGRTIPVFPAEELPEYLHEEQFEGDDEKVMIDYLTFFFDDLKRRGIVKNYKISKHY